MVTVGDAELSVTTMATWVVMILVTMSIAILVKQYVTVLVT